MARSLPRRMLLQMPFTPTQARAAGAATGRGPDQGSRPDTLSWRLALGLWVAFALAGWALTGLAMLVMA